MPPTVLDTDLMNAASLLTGPVERLRDAIAELTAERRERYAKIAESCQVEGDNWRRDIAAAIRRG